MNLKNILAITTAKKDLMKILTQAEKDQETYVLTKEGKACGVLMSVSEYEGLMETLEILSDPDTMQKLNESRDDLKKKKTYTHREVFSE